MVTPEDRTRMHELAHAALRREQPLDWFEEVYSGAARGEMNVPWAQGLANPHLVAVAEDLPLVGNGQPALVVGCGCGDDAEYLAQRGYAVTAFDLAPSAIETCRQRFPDSSVEYHVSDLFETPAEWEGHFELVVEIFTLQAMPPEFHAPGYARVIEWVARGGQLFLLARGRAADLPLTLDMGPPWPLSEPELRAAETLGFEVQRFDDFYDDEDPPKHRLRCVARRL